MNYNIIIQAQISFDDGILGANKSIVEALELMGCNFENINLTPREVEE